MIREEIHKVIAEEEQYSHNATVDIFGQTSNTKRENANTILISEKLNKSDEMAEALNILTINDSEYYVSDSANANDAKGDTASDTKTVTYTSDGKKRKVRSLAMKI